MATGEAIASVLHGFGITFRTPITKELAQTWIRALADVPDDLLQVAANRVVLECEFFPTPAKVRNLAGMNATQKPDVTGILNRIRGLTTYHPNIGDQMPSVERVRAELGDAIANAYGYIGPRRLEAVVFDGVGTGADIAAREFATALDDAQDAGQSVALPPMRQTKQIGTASQSVFYDNARPTRIGQHIAGLLGDTPP